MSEVINWPVLTKANIDTSYYLPVTSRRRIQLSSLLPSMATSGAGAESLYVNVTNGNQLNFKGIKSGDTGLLKVATATNNIVLTVLEAGIDLSLCDNSTSAFLSTVNLASNVTGVLPVANGGTGLSTIADGEFLYATGANTIGKTGATNVDGQLFIGNSVTGRASLATLTAGTGMTITNGAGTITLAASLASASANIDMNNFNINLDAAAGYSWLSGDGTSEGLTVDAAGQVFIGDNTPTVPTLSSQLTLGGNATNAISIGNTNNYKNHTVKVTNATSAVKGIDLLIEGADGQGNNDGGDITITAGATPGSGIGGSVNIISGYQVSGTIGEIDLRIGKAAGVSQSALTVDSNGDTNVKGRINFTQTPQTLTGAGAINLTSQITYIETTGANALSLADGVQGQTKQIVMTADLGDGTLGTITSSGFTSITFNDVGDTVSLMFLNSAWHIMGYYGVTIA